MWKSAVTAALAAFASFLPSLSQADAFDRGMNTMWEVLWHQSGTATRLVRWEQDLKVRIHGHNAAAHREHTLRALREAADTAGVKLIDVTDQPGAEQLANVSVEITPDHALSAWQPCETRLNYRSETTIDSVTMQMRDGDAERCAPHEAMHVMGVRGHPDGDTVLSYFQHETHGLLPLDKAMLRAWYSPRTRPGMTPFEVLPILADELVAILPNRTLAQQSRDRFLARTVAEMEAFVEGRGDVPAILKRSGKTSDIGIRFGRMEMGYFLGVAYEQGVVVRPDPALAAFWMQRAASMGNRAAAARSRPAA